MFKMVTTLPPIVNRKVVLAMASLCVYGILLILYANKSIMPYNYIIGNLYTSETNTTASQALQPTDRALVNFSETHENSSRSSIHTTPAPRPSISSASFSSAPSTLAINIPTPPLPTEPILTMFTTFKNTPTKDHIYKNTIHNWALLRPYVKPVMYIIPGEIDLKDYGKELGWDSHPVPKTSKHGVPVLRHMFLDAQMKYNSTFYAYTNGDILFNMDLLETLKAILPYKEKLKRMLLVGRRTNCQMRPGQQIRSLEEFMMVFKRGKLFHTNAQDYFISTKNGYPWDTIPDFVVGRVGYDNWLVVTALTKGIAVIDLSETVPALHQTGSDGNHAGHSKKPKGDTYINYGLAGGKFDYSLGHVSCSQFLTKRKDDSISIKERNVNNCEKTFRKYRSNPHLKLPT